MTAPNVPASVRARAVALAYESGVTRKDRALAVCEYFSEDLPVDEWLDLAGVKALARWALHGDAGEAEG